MIKSIIKRDGRVVLYDEGKIASAILKAMEAAQEGDASQGLCGCVANCSGSGSGEERFAAPSRPKSSRFRTRVESFQLMADGLRQRRQKIYFVPRVPAPACAR